ncbi:hypothetical protein PNQ92_10845 [Halobacterium salinarum]|uniref:hypothetical protein n=1 Tax=Halobacterium salinarum TaxID=2242 RepID=UPI002556D2C4|nr:hypothetical protein [Halobacterium salinarum]MDL0125902.1 hypothetical protein [Halobacterium salinarum]
MTDNTDPVSAGGDSDTDRKDCLPDEIDAEIYDKPEFVPEKTVTSLDSTPDNSECSELREKLGELQDILSERYDTVSDMLHPATLDATHGDDLKPDADFDFRPMVAAWIYRFIAPSDGYSKVSWEQLAEKLDKNAAFAENLGFDADDTPSEKTLRGHWRTRVLPAFRRHVRHMAAEKAVKAEDFDLETAENIRENLISDFEREDTEVDPIGEIEQEIKDDAYIFQADLIRDLCQFDRDDSTEWDTDLITDAGAHMCRLNTFSEQGIDRMGKEYGLIDESEDRREIFTEQTFRRTVRNVERAKVQHHDWSDQEDQVPGAEWIPEHELIDEATVDGDLREAMERAWMINPHSPTGVTSQWHRRTEEGIERQLQWLRDAGVISEGDSFNLRIDYTTHNYCRHSSTDSIPPIGVHKQTYLETGYAWKELQATIKINGRAFIIASVNFLPTNNQFQCVRYLIERAQELVNVDTILADAEFCTVAISQYARHRGCDFALRKGATESVKGTIEEEVSGTADWVDDWTMVSDGASDKIDATLVALEKNFKSKVDHSDDDEDEDDEQETTLDDFGDDEEDGEDDGPPGQITLNQAIDEVQEDEEDIDYFTIFTNKDIDSVGIDPDKNPIAHDHLNTAWGVGRVYRDRWGIETAFRDKKGQFAAKTRSRDLGYRRFLWMLENLLYNGWVMLNVGVADQSPDRDDDEIVVIQNTYLDELDRRVLGEIPGLEFPEIDYG